MVIKDINGDTHAAFAAMFEIFGTADATKATLITVEWFFGKSHPDVAFVAVIFGKFYFTLDALISAYCHTKTGNKIAISIKSSNQSTHIILVIIIIIE